MYQAVSSGCHRRWCRSRPEVDMQPSVRTAFSKAIDAYNPGVTFLVTIWVAGLSLRKYLAYHDQLTQLRYEALTSLIYVVPAMLVGWALIAWIERPAKS